MSFQPADGKKPQVLATCGHNTLPSQIAGVGLEAPMHMRDLLCMCHQYKTPGLVSFQFCCFLFAHALVQGAVCEVRMLSTPWPGKRLAPFKLWAWVSERCRMQTFGRKFLKDGDIVP